MRIDEPLPASPALVANQFADAWQSGQPVTIESVLESQTASGNADPEFARALVVALIQREIDLRRKAGQRPTAADYASRFPQLDSLLLEELVQLPALPPTRVRPPSLPDRYQVLEEIGRGGIGCIWRVLDNRLQRPLAIKVLNRHYRDYPEAEARLQREAMLTGSVQHPGVPPIHELGKTTDGASFFSMKLVEGDTLAQRLSQRQEGARELGTLIPIFEQVAQTLAYAHSQRIIHRDLKPANIMVGRFGEVQVMDWGLAKQLDARTTGPAVEAGPGPSRLPLETAASGPRATVTSASDSSLADPENDLSRAGDVIGTPAYMAPEQARGDLAAVGFTSDVFGLGAILFEILTGQRLHSGPSDVSPIQRAATGTLDRELQILENCGADTELIALCRRCLAREPERRPPNAEHVSSAIQQYLESVQERLKRSELDRLAVEVRAAEERKRRKTLTRIGLIVGLLTLIGIGTVLSQWKRAVDSEKQALQSERDALKSKEQAVAAQQLAQSRLKQTRKTVDDYFTTIARHRGMLNKTPGTLALRQLLLEKAKDYYENFLQENEHDQSLRIEMANAYARLGSITADLKPGSDAANEWFKKSIEVVETIEATNEFSRLDIDKLKADNFGRIGYQYLISNRYPPAVDAFEQALAPSIEIAAANPNMENRKAVAMHLLNLGMCQEKLEQTDSALECYLRAIAIGDELVDQFAEDSDLLVQVSRMHNNLGVLYGFRLKENAKALQECETSLDLARRGLAIDPDIPEYQNNVASSLNNTALMLHFNGRVDDSREAFVETAKVREAIVADNPDQPRFSETLTQTYNNLGTLFVLADQIDTAIEYYEKSVALNTKIADANPQMVRYRINCQEVLNSLASLYFEKGDREASVASMQAQRESVDHLIEAQPGNPQWPLIAIQLTLAIPGQSHPNLDGLLDAIDEKHDDKQFHTVHGLALFREGQFEDARNELENVLEDARGETWYSISAMCRWQLDQIEEAQQDLNAATEMILDKKHPQTLPMYLYAEAKELLQSELD